MSSEIRPEPFIELITPLDTSVNKELTIEEVDLMINRGWYQAPTQLMTMEQVRERYPEQVIDFERQTTYDKLSKQVIAVLYKFHDEKKRKFVFYVSPLMEEQINKAFKDAIKVV